MIGQSLDDVHTSDQAMSIQSLDDLVGSRNRLMVLRRLRWIEDRLWWHGSFKRSEAVERFGISPQQASQDISVYQHIRPESAKLDPSSKSYLRAAAAQPVFPKDPFRWIDEEMAESAPVLPLERLPSPSHRTDPGVMSALLTSFNSKQALSIEYQSMSRGEMSTRVICAHHIVDANHRHHVRAWDSLRGQFADFVIGRIMSAQPSLNYPWVDGLADQLWHEQVAIVLEPAPGLTQAQRLIVEKDYGMVNGRVEISVRRALVTYVAASLGILNEIQNANNSRMNQDFRCANVADLKKFVPKGKL